MTIKCGGMLRSITMAAYAIAAAVTVIVIAGQLFRRTSLSALVMSQAGGPKLTRDRPPCYAVGIEHESAIVIGVVVRAAGREGHCLYRPRQAPRGSIHARRFAGLPGGSGGRTGQHARDAELALRRADWDRLSIPSPFVNGQPMPMTAPCQVTGKVTFSAERTTRTS